MDNDIIIIDNFIPKILQNKLESVALGENNVDYYFRRDSSYYPNDERAVELRKNDSNIIDKKEWVFLHDLYVNNVESKFYKDFSCLFRHMQNNVFNTANLLRLRLVLSPPLPHAQHNYGPPHFDHDLNNVKAAVYYVSDSDGDTILFEETYLESRDASKKTLLQRISPKKGRIVIFDAVRFHSTSWPTKKERVIVNMNFSV
jgi:hypothetical protein